MVGRSAASKANVSVVAWMAGKRALAPKITQMIAGTPHSLYVEPFVGMGGVFFRRRQAPKAEVINDRNGDIANLFRILRDTIRSLWIR